MKRAKYSVINGLQEVPIADLWQADEDFLSLVDAIVVEMPNGGKIEINYRSSDGVLAISSREMEIIPRAANLIYIKDNGKSFY